MDTPPPPPEHAGLWTLAAIAIVLLVALVAANRPAHLSVGRAIMLLGAAAMIVSVLVIVVSTHHP